ncbi:hypothetical protein KZ344_00420 [Glaesserella parasuis]|nr:hypothetical protein [Glaesserella parasuis]MCT8778801.1 hypothetical protein [Glaesserella parasuis]
MVTSTISYFAMYNKFICYCLTIIHLSIALFVFSSFSIYQHFNKEGAWEAAVDVFTLLGGILAIGTVYTYFNIEQKTKEFKETHKEATEEIDNTKKQIILELKKLKENNQTLADLIQEYEIKQKFIDYIKYQQGQEKELKKYVNQEHRSVENCLLANIIKAKWFLDTAINSNEIHSILFAEKELIWGYRQLIDFDTDFYHLYINQVFNTLKLLNEYCHRKNEEWENYFQSELIDLMVDFVKEDERDKINILSKEYLKQFKQIYEEYVTTDVERNLFIKMINTENKKITKITKVLGLKRNNILVP